MLKRILVGILLAFCFSLTFAGKKGPSIILLPNIKTQYLMSINAIKAVKIQKQAIELVTKTLNITAASPYHAVRIRLIYKNQETLQAVIVYLLSSQYKFFELVRINLNPDFTIASIINNYELRPGDLAQSPNYAYKLAGRCPDKNVQFVIGNNFDNDGSVENEVQTVYQIAKDKGYHPILLDINNEDGPQPTVRAYINWLSCPDLKGFYNESHGWNEGIVLADDDFTYSLIDKSLTNKLKKEVILFDSCETFRPPLLTSMTNAKKANVQQYIAGYILLPFGPSERTASCIWSEAFEHRALDKKLIEICASKNNLELDAFRIAGNGDNHLNAAT